MSDANRVSIPSTLPVAYSKRTVPARRATRIANKRLVSAKREENLGWKRARLPAQKRAQRAVLAFMSSQPAGNVWPTAGLSQALSMMVETNKTAIRQIVRTKESVFNTRGSGRSAEITPFGFATESLQQYCAP
jgi:hypothetical protein